MTIAIIRIAGRVNVRADRAETLNRLRLGKKLTATFIDEKDAVAMGMLKSVKDLVCFGEVDKKLMDEVIAKRGQKDVKGVYRDFCRLHPPIGGFRKSTLIPAPKGILGKYADISKLLVKML